MIRTSQVDRPKAEGFRGQSRVNIQHFEYDESSPSAFSLQPTYLRSYHDSAT